MNISTEARRLAAALNLAGVPLVDENSESIQSRIERVGLTKTVSELNSAYEVLLHVGPYIIQSKNEHGYWSNDFGFAYDRDAATGYPEADIRNPEQLKLIKVLAPDAIFVAYDTVEDFLPEDAPALAVF